MMRTTWGGAIVVVGAGVIALDCTVSRPDATQTDGVQRSPQSEARLDELRSRFGVAFAERSSPRLSTKVSVEAARFADEQTRLTDLRSSMTIGFSLVKSAHAAGQFTHGATLFRGGLDGADVLHVERDDGLEDYVVFDERPLDERLFYSVDVSSVAGLRLVSNNLEFLDATGAPALRITAPYTIDAHGDKHAAHLALTDCNVDTNPASPWGRALTPPGAARCTVTVSWSQVDYPLLVDPSWSSTGSMAVARRDLTGTLLNTGKVLVTGGSNSGVEASAELYDPSSATFASTGSMTQGRYEHTATLLSSGKVLIAAGSNGSSLGTAELYDPGTGKFTATGSLTTTRDQPTATLLASGKVLITGGITGSTIVASAEIYDPGSGTFTSTGSMASTRAYHTATLLPSKKVLIAGGLANNAGVYSSAELFDPSSGTFSPTTGGMTDARYYHKAVLLTSGKVIVIAGNGFSQALDTAELYDPSASTFSMTGSMPGKRFWHEAATLPSGNVIAMGGFQQQSYAIYDPNAGKFTSTGSLNSLRSFFTAVALPSGRVLIAGGDSTSQNHLNSAEVFAGDLGDSCTSSDYCGSGHCVNGVCCNGACLGGCARCDLGGNLGTCSAAPANDPGTPSCSPFVCDGFQTNCPSACASDSQCVSTHYCGGDALCHPRKPPSSACDPKSDCKNGSNCQECSNGSCVDGFCCNSSCNGGCGQCNSPGKEGLCSPLPKGDQGRPTCVGSTCDGTSLNCPPCASDTMCPADRYCAINGVCLPRAGLGEVCDLVNNCKQPNCRECAQGDCIDGTCAALDDGGPDAASSSPTTTMTTTTSCGCSSAPGDSRSEGVFVTCVAFLLLARRARGRERAGRATRSVRRFSFARVQTLLLHGRNSTRSL